jgi:hypothetical protein
VLLMRRRTVLLRRGRRKFRLRAGLTLTVMLGLGLGVLAVAMHDPSPVGHFRDSLWRQKDSTDSPMKPVR